ncbi:[citrate (pro-3S)-lyase] ligase [Paraclostridium ghonii]|uniref:[Citrate [pro-3S]-lyase] ligase n=1 Tax=Paraclostridium ghonii TaxID=29358 RepID=A0ABU0N1D3_9FIRM|nr:[citrate (pro-3S)-lyase] ligase [Paeniclostridium ghonii]MDQ0556925.1 [citrate (pro-3S)-lyase] ligase [Paeniclostridium ghonii]
MYYNIETIDLKSKHECREVENFLSRFDLKYEDVDYTVVLKENKDIIATCSKLGKILKCFAVDNMYQGEGISNILISNITNKLFEDGVYHNYIYTKPENVYLFKNLGYGLIIETDKVSLLETGNKKIENTLSELIKKYNIDTTKEYASLVMNCNPFTLGHRYLIEKAANENQNVIVFLVEEDKSVFPFKTRFELVKNGVKDLNNVLVVESSEYIISTATFPTYFLKESDDSLKEYTKIDCNIFGKYFARKFNIKSRYVGSENSCIVTNAYNLSLKEILPKYDVDVKIIDRKQYDNKDISASKVRKLLCQDKIEEIKNIVPNLTYDFLLSEEGEKIRNEIKRNR